MAWLVTDKHFSATEFFSLNRSAGKAQYVKEIKIEKLWLLVGTRVGIGDGRPDHFIHFLLLLRMTSLAGTFPDLALRVHVPGNPAVLGKPYQEHNLKTVG